MSRLVYPLLLLLLATPALAGDIPPPTADEQVAAFEARCAESGEARAARHAETPLFERLGGEEGIHSLLREVVRLHGENEAVAHMFPEDEEGQAHVAERVAQFMIMGTGGPADAYDGPSLTDSHEHLRLTNADFMAAGGDVIQAMKNLEYGEEEIDEVVCALVSLRDQVVLPAEEAMEEAAGEEAAGEGGGW